MKQPSQAIRAQRRYGRILNEIFAQEKVAAEVERRKHGETISPDAAIAEGLDPFEMAREANELARAG